MTNGLKAHDFRDIIIVLVISPLAHVYFHYIYISTTSHCLPRQEKYD